MIIGHRNYRWYDKVMIKLLYDEFVMIYDHHNIFRKYGHWCFFAYLNVHYLFNIFVYGSLICIYLMNTLVNWLRSALRSTLDLRKVSSVTECIMFVAYILFNKHFKKKTTKYYNRRHIDVHLMIKQCTQCVLAYMSVLLPRQLMFH